MPQAANAVRDFPYLAACKGLANLHRQGQTGEQITKSVGVSKSLINYDVAVGYFPEDITRLIQEDSEHGQEDERPLSWSANTLRALLPLRIQMKEIHPGEVVPQDELYDYTEVRRAVEQIIGGDIATIEKLHEYVERRRRELFEERFNKALQMRLEAEVGQAKQAIQEAHQQSLQHVEEETAHHYEAQIRQLQQQLGELETRHQTVGL